MGENRKKITQENEENGLFFIECTDDEAECADDEAEVAPRKAKPEKILQHPRLMHRRDAPQLPTSIYFPQSQFDLKVVDVNMGKRILLPCQIRRRCQVERERMTLEDE